MIPNYSKRCNFNVVLTYESVSTINTQPATSTMLFFQSLPKLGETLIFKHS